MAKQICLLCNSLASGGAEKMVANLSKSFSKKNNKVTIVSMQDDIVYDYEGELFNFGAIKNSTSRINAFWIFRKFFKTHNFDVIIDHRVRNRFIKEFLFSKLIFNTTPVIYCIHNYEMGYSFAYPKNKFLSKLQHTNSATFVAVSESIQTELRHKLNIESELIYNFVDVDNIQKLSHEPNPSIEGDYVIGVGRLTKIKQFDELIEAYSNSVLPSKLIDLKILGDGPERDNLLHLISLKYLDKHISLIPFQENPYNFISNAKALILSSKVEGFPMVILEALFLKTPVVSYDCESGPAEMIDNQVNGILVEDQNVAVLTVALNTIVTENKKFKKKGVKLQSFEEETIVNQWIRLLETDNHV